jgi:uncharacterized spore protein YtfJ
MSEKFEKVAAAAAGNQELAAQVVGKLFDVAQPGSVYAEPVTAGDHTVITASEVSVGMGFGLGIGGGEGRGGPKKETNEDEPVEDEAEYEGEGSGLGGGGGGGGASLARPVAVISVGPEGIQVEPVVDPTKIAIAFFTTLGSMLFMLSRMRKG